MNTKLRGKKLDLAQLGNAIVEQAEKLGMKTKKVAKKAVKAARVKSVKVTAKVKAKVKK